MLKEFFQKWKNTEEAAEKGQTAPEETERAKEELTMEAQTEEKEEPGKAEPPSVQELERVWFRRLVSHNIRMPMTIITGYGELLRNGSFKTREEEMECIGKICKNIEFMDTLLKVLLDDVSNEELVKEKEWFDLLACGRETFEYVKNIARKSNIAVTVNSSKEKVSFYGNRIVMRRALFNLIENSLRYMNRAGNICMTIEETEEEIYLIYRDDGEGMDEKEAERITELSYQGSNAGKTGNGIGMYLVKDAVEKNGGTMKIHTGIGKGMGVVMSFQKQNR